MFLFHNLISNTVISSFTLDAPLNRDHNYPAPTTIFPSTDIEVEKIIVHAEFNHPHPVEHDVALIKLKGVVDFSTAYAGPACMPNEGDDYHGAEGCWLSGKYILHSSCFVKFAID